MVEVDTLLRDVKCKCGRCSYLQGVPFYLRLTIKEIRDWRASSGDVHTCPQGHTLNYESALCYFRVDDRGQTIDPTHPNWTSSKIKEE